MSSKPNRTTGKHSPGQQDNKPTGPTERCTGTGQCADTADRTTRQHGQWEDMPTLPAGQHANAAYRTADQHGGWARTESGIILQHIFNGGAVGIRQYKGGVDATSPAAFPLATG